MIITVYSKYSIVAFLIVHIILGGDISGSDDIAYSVGLRVLKVGRSGSFEGQLQKVLKACSFCTDKNILLYCRGFTWVMISLISEAV